MASLLEFANEVAANIGNAEVREIEKANGVIYTGIVVRQDESVAATVYVDDMYEKGYSVPAAVAEVNNILKNSGEKHFDTERFMDYEGYVKANLRARLYNKATNAEVKRTAAFFGFEDLIIVPYVNVSMHDGTRGSVKVKKELLDAWNVSESEVIDQALRNSANDVYVEDMLKMIAGMQGISVEEFEKIYDGPRQLVISNNDKIYGSVSILFMIDKLKEKFEKGFYVLPSSIHEVIVQPMPEEPVDKELFDKMVRDVNESTVSSEEILSDRAYFFE